MTLGHHDKKPFPIVLFQELFDLIFWIFYKMRFIVLRAVITFIRPKSSWICLTIEFVFFNILSVQQTWSIGILTPPHPPITITALRWESVLIRMIFRFIFYFSLKINILQFHLWSFFVSYMPCSMWYFIPSYVVLAKSSPENISKIKTVQNQIVIYAIEKNLWR